MQQVGGILGSCRKGACSLVTPMNDTAELVAGIDIGTQGVRVVVANANGAVVAQASEPFQLPDVTSTSSHHHFEQDPQEWWQKTCACFRHIGQQQSNVLDRIAAIAVTATSGTICLLDGNGSPTYPAIMYSDRRSGEEATWLNQHTYDGTTRLGYRFDASFALPKLLWMQHHKPEVMQATHFFAHAADVVTGHLTGDYGISDWSHALKNGYDLLEDRWLPIIGETVPLPRDKFPRIVAPGTVIGTVSSDAATETNVPTGITVIAGMTDGCCSQIAGGAVAAGQWLSVLGTTLVLKGVTQDFLCDPLGRIYSHRHPNGMWLPGAASNVGGEVLARRFAGADLAALDADAETIMPSGIICYPLEGKGERFPFQHAHAEGFLLGNADTDSTYYSACLEGVGYVERLAYDTLEQMGATITAPIRATGGGSRSDIWLRIRATILNRQLEVPQQTGAAFGAAVLAASASLYPDLITATQAMVHMHKQVEPLPIADEYTAYYQQFVAACIERGYLMQ